MIQAVQLEKKKFTYGDYLTWPEEERWEIIEGIPYAMTPAPSRAHQEILVDLLRQISTFLLEAACRVYAAPFDVRLPEAGEADADIATVVQPDLAVICDSSKLDERGCRGAPDFIIEIISPATAVKDQIHKVALYEKHGVREYWLVHPTDRLVTIRLLGTDGRYGPPLIHEATGTLPVATLPGLEIDLDAVFRRV
jgi:Uma2 family endonuclease